MKYEFEYQCDKPWDEMKGSGRKRHCDSCDKKVHHISHMTKKQALAFLESKNWECCVDFYGTARGEIEFREEEQRRLLQADGVKQLVAAALAFVPLALGAAFIDVDAQPSAPQMASVAPLDLSGPTPELPPLEFEPLEPAVIAPFEPVTPEPVVLPEPVEVVEIPPVVEELPEVDEVEVVPPKPIRPHVRGRIKRPPAHEIHLWEGP